MNVHHATSGPHWLAAAALLAHAVTRAIPAQMPQVGGTRPVISRDGQWISYQAAHDGVWDIYVARIDGSGERRVTDYAEKTSLRSGPRRGSVTTF